MNKKINMDSRSVLILLILVSLNVVLIAVSNIVAVKIVDLGGIVFAASAVVYAFTFLISDIISEIWGKEIAKFTVWAGVITNVLMMIVIYIVINLNPSELWPNQSEFELILGSVPRIVIASLIAYTISQNVDVVLFDYFKKLTSGKNLWIRNNASTIISQLVDSIAFFGIGFLGVFDINELFQLAMAQYLLKIVIAIVDTALIYPARAFLISKGIKGGIEEYEEVKEK